MTHRPSQRLSTRMHTGRVFRNSVSGNSSEINLRGAKMQYELQGGERRRKGLGKKLHFCHGDFSPKSSNKAQRALIDTKGTLIDERPFSQCERPFKVATGMGRGTQRA